MVLYITTHVDDFGRRIYFDEKEKRYVDVNINDNNPYIHTVTKDGEPNYPVTVTEISSKWVDHLYKRSSIALTRLLVNPQYSQQDNEKVEEEIARIIKECVRLSNLHK